MAPLTLIRPGFFGCSVTGGGVDSTPPSELGRRSRDRRKNLHVRQLWRNLPSCKKKNEKFHSLDFILINYVNLCMESLFCSKSENKAPRIPIFCVNILCSILFSVLEKKNWYLN